MDENEIIGMLIDNSDEPYAEEIASMVMSCRRKKKPIETTGDFRDVIVSALSFLPENKEKFSWVLQEIYQGVKRLKDRKIISFCLNSYKSNI